MRMEWVTSLSSPLLSPLVKEGKVMESVNTYKVGSVVAGRVPGGKCRTRRSAREASAAFAARRMAAISSLSSSSSDGEVYVHRMSAMLPPEE
jgi:hypothetical protein